MTDEEIIEFLIENSDYFKTSSFLGDAARQVGWGFLKLLKSVADGCQNLFDQAFSLFDFTSSNVFMTFWNEYRTVMIPLMILFLAAFGFKLILNVEKKTTPIVKNVFILMAVATSMTTVVPFMNDSIGALRNGVLGNGSMTTEANDVINANLWDLAYIDKRNQLTDFELHYNSMTSARIKNLDITAKVTDDDEGISSRAGQIYGNMIVDDGTGVEEANYVVMEIKSSLLGLIDPPYYYRYRVDYSASIISLLALCLVFLYYTFKIIQLLFEFIVAELLAVIFAPDIDGGQKMSKILNAMLGIFTTMAVIILIIKIYTLMIAYIGQQSYGGFAKAVYMLAVSWAVIVGPSIVPRVIGYDIGVGQYFSGMILEGAGRLALKGIGSLAGKIGEGRAMDNGSEGNSSSSGDGNDSDNSERERAEGQENKTSENQGTNGADRKNEESDMGDETGGVQDGEENASDEAGYEPQGWYDSEDNQESGEEGSGYSTYQPPEEDNEPERNSEDQNPAVAEDRSGEGLRQDGHGNESFGKMPENGESGGNQDELSKNGYKSEGQFENWQIYSKWKYEQDSKNQGSEKNDTGKEENR